MILPLDFSEIFISFFLIQAVQDSIERQREAAKRRIEEKRRKRDEKQYEEDLALSILSAADKNLVLKREKTTLQKSKQSSSVSLGELALVFLQETINRLAVLVWRGAPVGFTGAYLISDPRQGCFKERGT